MRAVVVARGDAGTTRISVDAPGARVVEIAGDFTDWKPVPLARGADGWWSVARALPPGVRQLAVRADGGAWMPPPGLAVTRDEFGEPVGLLVVPER